MVGGVHRLELVVRLIAGADRLHDQERPEVASSANQPGHEERHARASFGRVSRGPPPATSTMVLAADITPPATTNAMPNPEASTPSHTARTPVARTNRPDTRQPRQRARQIARVPRRTRTCCVSAISGPPSRCGSSPVATAKYRREAATPRKMDQLRVGDWAACSGTTAGRRSPARDARRRGTPAAASPTAPRRRP